MVSGAVFISGIQPAVAQTSAENKKFRAAIIGHTARGNYGHGLDVIFNGRDDVEVVAVADPHESGRMQAMKRCRAQRGYADYREMLDREKPQLVSIAPRWTDQHYVMGAAALQAGAHVFMEKPITQTLAEADELVTSAARKNLKIAVAHQMRLDPGIVKLKKALAAGQFGHLLELRAHGKQDHRAGGEDLIVLGTHLFDLMRLFAGDPLWCEARVLHNGTDITIEDARDATENVGPVAGDEVRAWYAFPNGINASFTSRARYRDTAGPWGIELIGSKGRARILADIEPEIYVMESDDWSATGKTDRWQPFGETGLPSSEKGTAAANRRLAEDWLSAIRNDREPACSGADGLNALEMVMAVYQSALKSSRVTFPLKTRAHPLAKG